MTKETPNILIIEARFYEDLADELVRGAVEALEEAGATYERVAVPGVLEIPAALSMAMAAVEDGYSDYDGYVALGVVIRGETTHYDIVANESARAIMNLAVEGCVAVGNGIQTVENGLQAWARARVEEKDKGGAAARAALTMIELREKFGIEE
ncbi:6,7-dimethyl-8-ribityllumazine synthase [uncultured Cohaesibacter sp.]|uniref:6,7-dimethyl-8-ribityllumazine synthase n=1 Tax=uncultured Cohaesibacter sp. TaxID=1002546 RepID=UPI002AABAB2A|nr:6,7-dimethyl-8-ribityllumazine synthase [uncultured Cohaesibacter sp.]